MIMDDSKFFELEGGRFNVWNQTFTDSDTGKAALFHSFVLAFLKLLKMIALGEIPPSMG